MLHCPAATHGYQLLCQKALAEGIAQSGKYDSVMSAVAVDERNDVLAACLQASRLGELRQWGALFRGKARVEVSHISSGQAGSKSTTLMASGLIGWTMFVSSMVSIPKNACSDGDQLNPSRRLH